MRAIVDSVNGIVQSVRYEPDDKEDIPQPETDAAAEPDPKHKHKHKGKGAKR